MSDIKAYVMPFSHMDLFWLGAEQDCLSRGNRIISQVMSMAEKYPEFRYLIEDLIFVDHFIKCHPEQKAKLKELVQKGQIELGPKWTGIDQTPQVGEDLVRNSMYALEYLEKEFEYTAKTMHTGDLPGWTPQYPQIADKLGIPYVIFTRTGPADTSLFYWIGLDGTKTLVWYSLKGYPWAWERGFEISAENAIEKGLEKEIKEILAQGVEPIFVHYGVDLILPGEKLPQNVTRWNELSDVKMAFTTPTEYFEKAPKKNLRELTGEVPSSWSYSDPQYPQFMSLTLPSVAALTTGEKFAAIVWAKGYLKEYPAAKIKEGWLRVLEGMDHNNNGQGWDFTLPRKVSLYQQGIQAGESAGQEALRVIAENVKVPFGSECNPIVVFNPSSWERTDVVKAHVTYHGDISPFDIAKYRNVKLVDEAGNPVDFQQVDTREGVSREDYLQFIATQVPALGYKTYYVLPVAATPQVEPFCKQEELTFTTPYHVIDIDKVTGVVSVKDRESGKQSLNKLFLVGIEELPENGSFCDYGTGRRFENAIQSVELVENGNVRAVIEIKGKVAESDVMQQIILYKDIKTIDLVNTIDWNQWRPMRMQQVFDTGVENPEINYGVPYGVSSFTNVMPNTKPNRPDEMPLESWKKLRNCIQWIDISGRGHGVTIGAKHRCFSIEGSTISATMLRGVVSSQLVLIQDGKRMPHHRPIQGRYVFTYSLLPHANSWVEAKSYRAGWHLNYPLIPVTVNDPYTTKNLPIKDCFIKLESDTDSLILTVLKKAEEGNELVLRFYETEGKGGTATLNLPGGKIEVLQLCNLRENPLSKLDPKEEIKYKPFEIITLKVGYSFIASL